MKKFKRLVAALLVAVMALTMLTACGGSGATYTGNTELYNQDGVKITLIGGLDTKGSIFGPQLKLYIENNTNRDIMVQSRKTSVNGYTMGDFGAIMSIDVAKGGKAYGTYTLYSSKLKAANITRIESIKTSFCIIDADSYRTLVNTNMITITF